MKAQVNGKLFHISYHAKLRFSMRVDSSKSFKKEFVEEGCLVSLNRGYDRGIWNKKIGAVFLLNDDGHIGTTISDSEIGLYEGSLKKCDCEFLVQSENGQYVCNSCGKNLGCDNVVEVKS